MAAAVDIGARVRFTYTSRVGGGRLDFEGEIVRWRRDRRGPVGWYDVRCTDGIERSVRPTRVNVLAAREQRRNSPSPIAGKSELEQRPNRGSGMSIPGLPERTGKQPGRHVTLWTSSADYDQLLALQRERGGAPISVLALEAFRQGLAAMTEGAAQQ